MREVAAEYKKHNIPIDSIYLDIDYMERYKDFTINRDSFADFEELVEECEDILKYIDVLVDGAFVAEKKNLKLKFRGSENQRIINVKKSLEDKTVTELTEGEYDEY